MLPYCRAALGRALVLISTTTTIACGSGSTEQQGPTSMTDSGAPDSSTPAPPVDAGSDSDSGAPNASDASPDGTAEDGASRADAGDAASRTDATDGAASEDGGDAASNGDASDAGSRADASDGASNDDATTSTLVAEAGFFDLPPQPTAATYAARMFYAFRPADQDAEHKPLAVFFNGGPGAPTSFGLLSFGTGPMTLDTATMSPTPVANAGSWTRFANLLYLDERMAGFSYGLGATALPSCVMSEQEDAGDFVRSLLAFLDGHQAIRANRVVFVGESYGGIRATRMLDILLRYKSEASSAGADLPALIQAHYDAIFPAMAGQPIPEATAATQFGAQVLIEPVVLGNVQMTEQLNIMPMDPYVGNVPASQDPYDVRKPMSYEDAITSLVLGAMSTESSAASLLGVPLASIPRLGPSARQGAFHPNLAAVNGVAQANAALTTLLGALGTQDAYVALFGSQCPTPADWMDPAVADLFVENMLSVRTFITHARYDQVVYTPAIPGAFQNAGWTVVVESAPRAGVVNPGWFKVTDTMGHSTEVRWPPYDSSGHMVAMTEGAELATDVQGWLAGQ
jgi:hypothetical protein